MNIEEYEYLWDGSEIGWVLHYVDNVVWNITYIFSNKSPSKEEIVTLRKLVPEFNNKSLSLIVRSLQECDEYTVLYSYGNIEAKAIESKAKQAGLKYRLTPKQLGGYLPVSKEGNVLIIEDNDLSTTVCKKMLESGVQVVQHMHVD